MSEQPQRPRGTGKVRPAQEPISALAAHSPWMPPEAAPEFVTALQALNNGEASAHQQKLALEGVIELTKNGMALYFPGEAGRRDTDFALGRLFVGQMIITFLRRKLKRGGEQG